ncbi:MAG: UDP-N-acetylmuramoyl-L-alanyl-D-glutamate--2,6-diaminopimelate ligase [Verrucomicrobia bacterium]|nr:UDP-N-acetylmuramoyl-L-alanyl-D-glutamate--2,6-diaminopimelate ligase [Verrucomicrobiota bacterium]MBU1735236.1 UDP-N-acetylmuramoyl-L-alanyl-D-glutamate--2,6-diaminopimelate ligase [Verrucomicrobiota bacterium]MBU1857626.1 UDP-N-acetylmuramoyl-L-alanyl-D-glutamate--2,6-diaminopimelate ligase [Verrucomicrobiota bacterium]
MKLSTLLAVIKPLAVGRPGDPDIKGLAYDSRKIKPGFIFFALHGQNQDGNQFVPDAVTRGAAAVVSDQAAPVSHGPAIIIRVSDPRQAMAELAAAFNNNPSANLQVVGITGTNGKTTTAFMLRDIFTDAGRHTGLIGTVAYEIGGRTIPANRTTPESVDLQDMLAQMVHVGCQSAVVEVSSHALIQKRVGGIDFDVAVFTNLTHDHLDYHATKENYFQAKVLLFRGLSRCHKKPVAVVNLDDPYGRELVRDVPLEADLITYATGQDAAVRAVNLQITSAGSVFEVHSPWGEAQVKLKLLGHYNVSNTLAALAVAGATGVPLARAAQVVSQMMAVPGRLEEISIEGGFQVFVDYAHTEDALHNVLSTLREITPGKLIVVFGCGGNRDRKKRPLMGAVATRLADYVLLTSDNPRKENPIEIIAQIRAGCKHSDNVEVVEDRHEAIIRALSMAEKGDVVLIAGKGHENYQEFTNTVIPFDDRQVVRECLGISHA